MLTFQVCNLKLGSWAYNGFQVDVTKRSDTIDLSNYVDNGEWKLIGVKVRNIWPWKGNTWKPINDKIVIMHLREKLKVRENFGIKLQIKTENIAYFNYYGRLHILYKTT